MVSELLTSDEIERIEQDKRFYQFQEKLQLAKLAIEIVLILMIKLLYLRGF